MTTGLAATTLANKWLDMLGGTAFTAPAGAWAKLCIADPGPTGTAGGSASSVTTRMQFTWSAASAGSKAITTTLPAWTNWAGTNGEVVSHISVWDASAAGNFLYSYALTASKTVNTGDTLTLTSHTASLTPIAA
jgi:hypothetical protein